MRRLYGPLGQRPLVLESDEEVVWSAGVSGPYRWKVMRRLYGPLGQRPLPLEGE